MKYNFFFFFKSFKFKFDLNTFLFISIERGKINSKRIFLSFPFSYSPYLYILSEKSIFFFWHRCVFCFVLVVFICCQIFFIGVLLVYVSLRLLGYVFFYAFVCFLVYGSENDGLVEDYCFLLMWFSFKNSKGSVWLLTNWTHPSTWVLMRMIETCCGWWYDLFDSSIFQICWDLQVSRRRICLYSSTAFLSVLIHVTVLEMLSSKKLLCLMLCSESCWHLDFHIVLAVNPFPIFKPQLL